MSALPAPFVSDAIGIPSQSAMPAAPGTACTMSLPKGGTAASSSSLGNHSVQSGNVHRVVPLAITTNSTYAQGVARTRTEWIRALAQNGLKATSPYKAEAWLFALQKAGLLERYEKVPRGLREGFSFNYSAIRVTQAPPNKDSVVEFADVFADTVAAEIKKGRYVGPFSQDEIESIIGPFQSSPFSIIPKPGKPGKFRLIQNLSFPRSTSHIYPNPSINSGVDSDEFPCTWGTFDTICLVISRLPPGSEAAVRDVAEAYRTIPLHHTQWPSTVVRVGSNSFCLDLNSCFGAAPAAGSYGHVGDAGVDLFCANGMGPVSKWVDDHVFFRIQCAFYKAYNAQRQKWHQDISERGPHQSGGRLWFGGQLFEDGTLEQFDEDCQFPCIDLSTASERSPHDAQFTYCMSDIDQFSSSLGIPWEYSKDVPFSATPTFIGFIWNLADLTVSLSPSKKTKYLSAIQDWLLSSQHVLQEVQSLYGKLLHACLVHPAGRSRLTGLETMLAVGRNRPFIPRHAPFSVRTDLAWWAAWLNGASTSRSIPRPVSLVDVGAFSDASSGVGIGIVIGDKWRAWRLIPGWKTLNGSRDIGWAEAVGFELLIRALFTIHNTTQHYKLYGDNKGVVEGWWNGRSRNHSVNEVFRRIQDYLASMDATELIHSEYVPSAKNPADAPSRGIYSSVSLLLPDIGLPTELASFLIDSQYELSATELRLYREGAYPSAAAKHITSTINAASARRNFHTERLREHDSACQTIKSPAT